MCELLKLKIFVINMECAKERRAIMETRLGELGLAAEFIPAVEGARLDRKTLISPASAAHLSNGELGCYLSHIRAWEEIRKRQISYSVVMEDDVVINPNMMRILADLINLDFNFDAVRLSALKPQKGRVISRLTGGESVMLPTKNPSGAQGYLVTFSGARKLLTVLGIPARPIDDEFDNYWDKGLCIPMVSPAPIREDNMIPSSISGRFGDFEKKGFISHIKRVARSQKRKIKVFLLAKNLKK